MDKKMNEVMEKLMAGMGPTALQNMHKGDYWRVYIPSELGYGTSDYSTIPGYSVLVFDLTLLDFSPVGEAMKPWR